ncbi:hypothetical protein EVAR_19177_1 [Eumeta japonica]|uniref:Uncharacterized protein n=1 Tax=Eumeta variegata TaxID=151549 RepID=A0A4C1VLR6_EUMVA|nr:hypothetical protein EVAR_19177_1 [Eumeta japonica]
MRHMPPAPIRSLISRSELRLDRTKNHMPIRGDTLCCQMCLLKYAIRSRTSWYLAAFRGTVSKINLSHILIVSRAGFGRTALVTSRCRCQRPGGGGRGQLATPRTAAIPEPCADSPAVAPSAKRLSRARTPRRGRARRPSIGPPPNTVRYDFLHCKRQSIWNSPLYRYQPRYFWITSR